MARHDDAFDLADPARAAGGGRRCSGLGNYPLHLVIMALLWGFIYTSWSIMGRLGMVSFGHGAFLGIGAYGVGAAVEPVRASRRGSAPRLRSWSRVVARGADRLPVLPLQDRRPLLRAGHAGAVGGGAADHRRAARPDRRLARHHAEDRALPTASHRTRWRRCSSPTRWSGSTLMLACWLIALLDLAPRRPQHEPAGARGDQRGGGRGRVDRHRRARAPSCRSRCCRRR